MNGSISAVLAIEPGGSGFAAVNTPSSGTRWISLTGAPTGVT